MVKPGLNNVALALSAISRGVISSPDCFPEADSFESISWFTCPADDQGWYGLSMDSSYTVAAAEQACADAGGAVISVLVVSSQNAWNLFNVQIFLELW